MLVYTSLCIFNILKIDKFEGQLNLKKTIKFGCTK